MHIKNIFIFRFKKNIEKFLNSFFFKSNFLILNCFELLYDHVKNKNFKNKK